MSLNDIIETDTEVETFEEVELAPQPAAKKARKTKKKSKKSKKAVKKSRKATKTAIKAKRRARRAAAKKARGGKTLAQCAVACMQKLKKPVTAAQLLKHMNKTTKISAFVLGHVLKSLKAKGVIRANKGAFKLTGKAMPKKKTAPLFKKGRVARKTAAKKTKKAKKSKRSVKSRK